MSKKVNQKKEKVKPVQQTDIPAVTTKKSAVTFKTLYTGVFKIAIWIKDSKGELEKKYIEFKNHTRIEFDKEIIEQIKKKMKEYEDSDIPLNKRDILTEDEFYQITSPERLYINYNGENIHISDIRQGLAIAENHGWKPVYREVIQTGHSKSTVQRGDMGVGGVKM